MNYKLGFIGAGHMGSTLAGAACKKVAPENVLVSDRDSGRTALLSAGLGCAAGNAIDAAEKCEYIFIGVKPQNMEELFEEIVPVLKKRKDRFVLVSMAAGYTIKRIEELSGASVPVIRIMPNTPVAVEAGCVLYDVNPEVTKDELSEFLAFMSACGEVAALPEELIDAGCAISGCGPAFVYEFIMALASAGEKLGLPADKALLLSKSTVYGASKLALKSGEEPGKLCRDVCSPGGATIEGVKILESIGFFGNVEAAAEASYRRTKELSGN